MIRCNESVSGDSIPSAPLLMTASLTTCRRPRTKRCTQMAKLRFPTCVECFAGILPVLANATSHRDAADVLAWMGPESRDAEIALGLPGER